MNFIDRFLNGITMYRLVLYYLMLLLGVAVIYCFLGVLHFNPFLMLVTIGILVGVSWITNELFSKVFNAPTNIESVYISALILALIVSPIKSVQDIPFIIWASVLTMASKYILAINKKHIFNPVAIAVVLTAYGFNGVASWWVGTSSMIPFLLLGALIVRKIQRFDLVFYFFLSTFVTMFGLTALKGGSMETVLHNVLFSSSLLFFAFVMLTEPLTSPPTKLLQSIYGAIVGLFFAPQFHIGSFFASPEMGLVIGNVFTYVVSPKFKVITTLKEKMQIAPDIFEFLFVPEKKIAFVPGQYMEWTVPHSHTDSRGNRRYFTIASSPTEDTLRLGVKFYPNGSSYKRALSTMDTKTPIIGAQVAGDFTLPADPKKKLVFVAGGIGITPFRSMIKYLIDTKQKRDIILIYSNRVRNEIIYADVFDQAQKELGIKTVYTLTDVNHISPDWDQMKGRVDALMIQQEVPDFLNRTFYISGTHAMVDAMHDLLKSMRIPEAQIKTDFFPGFV